MIGLLTTTPVSPNPCGQKHSTLQCMYRIGCQQRHWAVVCHLRPFTRCFALTCIWHTMCLLLSWQNDWRSLMTGWQYVSLWGTSMREVATKFGTWKDKLSSNFFFSCNTNGSAMTRLQSPVVKTRVSVIEREIEGFLWLDARQAAPTRRSRSDKLD